MHAYSPAQAETQDTETEASLDHRIRFQKQIWTRGTQRVSGDGKGHDKGGGCSQCIIITCMKSFKTKI